MEMVTKATECEEAALILNLKDTSTNSNQYQGLPYGCTYANTDWLSFAPAKGDGDENVPCGTISAGIKYDCICKHATSGSSKYKYIFKYTHRKYKTKN